MAEFASHRRYCLYKRHSARERGDLALESLWRAKQEASASPVLPETFPARAQLAAVGYTATADLVGADVDELVEYAGLSDRTARAVLKAAAAL